MKQIHKFLHILQNLSDIKNKDLKGEKKMVKFKTVEEFVPEVHQLWLSGKFIVIDKDTGEVIEDGENGKGYETAEEAMNAFNAKFNR